MANKNQMRINRVLAKQRKTGVAVNTCQPEGKRPKAYRGRKSSDNQS